MDDNKLMLNYAQTDNSGVYGMSEENRNRKQVQISLSENQLAATDKAATERGMNRSEFVRYLLSQVIENFPDDLLGKGEYERTPKN